MKRNKLRELLSQDKPSIGARLLSPWPGVVEVMGKTGVFDYVEFCAEYSPWDLHDLDNFARAVELSEMSSMIKIDQNPVSFLTQRSLGSGIQNILFTDIRNVEDAKECIRCAKPETPKYKGTNGCHMRRNVGYVLDCGSTDYVDAMNDSVLAFMIEKKEAVDNLEEIFSVEGIDMVQWGPCDYSLSVGLAGQWSHPDVKKAELKVINTAIKMGIRPRYEINSIQITDEDIKQYIDLGIKDISLPSDVVVLFNWLRNYGESVRKLLD